jgi:hypothetical protein
MASNLGFANPEQDWQAYLNTVNKKKRATMPSPYAPSPTSATAPYNPTTQSFTHTPYEAGNSPYNPTTQSFPHQPYDLGAAAAANSAVSSAPAKKDTPTTSTPATKKTGPDGKTSDDMTVHPGRFYSDYNYTAAKDLADNDPSFIANKWAGFYNYGGKAYANQLNSTIADPRNLLLAMGVNPGRLQDPSDYLDWTQRLYDQASGRTQGNTGGYQYMSGRGMVHNILNARYDQKNPTNDIGHMIADPSMDPKTQIANTISLLKSTMQSVLNPDSLNAYVATLNNLAVDFIEQKNKDPKSWDNITFNQYVQKQLGSGGGVY